MLDKLSRLSGYDLKVKINDVKNLRLKDGEKKTVFLLAIRFSLLPGEKQSLTKSRHFKEFLTSVQPIIKKYSGARLLSSAPVYVYIFSKGTAEMHTEAVLTAALEIKDLLKENYPGVSAVLYAKHQQILTGGKARYDEIKPFSPKQENSILKKVKKVLTHAKKGQVLVSSEVKKSGENLFKFDKPLQEKSLKDAFYEVTGGITKESYAFISPADRKLSAFTGRAKELRQITDTYNELKYSIAFPPGASGRRDEKPPVIGIAGEAGIGKSRLAGEFIRKQAGMKNVFAGRSSRMLPEPYSVFTSAVRASAGITSADDKARRKKKLEMLYGKINSVLTVRNEITRFKKSKAIIGYLLGMEYKDSRLNLKGSDKEDSELRSHIHISLRHFIEAFAVDVNAGGSPLVFAMDDCQWMDTASREALIHILGTLNLENKREGKGKHKSTQARLAHIMFIILYRPGFQPGRKLEKEADFREIELKPLDEASSEKLVKKLAGTSEKDFTQEILRKSAGNPLFIEEWLNLFIEQSGKVKPGNKSEIPGNISSLMESRLESLEKGQKLLLQKASILGKRFSGEILYAIEKKFDAGHKYAERLDALCGKGFIYPLYTGAGTGSPDDRYGTYSFKHDIIQEVVYNLTLSENRKIIHRIAAEVLEERFKDEIENHFFELAYHYARTDSERKTIYYLRKAGDKAKEEYKNELALEFYDELLKPLNTSEQSRQVYDALIKKGEVLIHIGKWDEAEKILDQFFRLSEGIKNDDLKAMALSSLGEILNYKHDYYEALHKFKEALKLFEYERNYIGIIKSIGLIGTVYSKTAKYDQAKKAFEKQLELSKKNKENKMITSAYHNLGLLYKRLGKYKTALEYYSINLELHKKSGNKKGVASTFSLIGTIFYYKGELNKALNFFELSLKLNEELGFKLSNALVNGNIGSIYFSKNNFNKAMEYYEKQKTLFEELDDEAGIATSFGHIGNIALSEGRYLEALNFYKIQLKINEKIGRRIAIAIATGNIGVVYSHLGRLDKAIGCFHNQLHMDRKLSNSEGIMRAYKNIADVYKKKKNYHYAKLNYEKAIKLGNKYELKKYLLSTLIEFTELLFSSNDIYKAISFAKKAAKLSIKYGTSQDIKRCEAFLQKKNTLTKL